MSGLLKANLQLGDSATATQNFTLSVPATPDGTVKLARGNAGATSQDILTVDANGRVAMPNNVVAFSAYQSSAQAVSSATWTKLQFQSEEFDTASYFDSTTNYRFQPAVAGYYQLTGAAQLVSTAPTFSELGVYKNGTLYKRGGSPTASVNTDRATASCLVYLNGSTDYVELWGYVNAGQNSSAGQTLTYFQGILIAKA